MPIIQLLREFDNFTDTEKRIVDFILNNLDSISNLTITDIATATYTSHSTIVRMTKKLKFSGYKEFKTVLVKAALTEFNQEKQVDNNFPFDSQSSDKEVIKTLSDLTKNTINKIALQTDTKTLSKMSDCLLQSPKIMIYGQGDSQITARSFQNKLVKLNKVAIIAEEYREEAWNTANLTPNDCALFISYGGRMEHYQKLMGYLKSHQIPILLLTGNINSDLLKFSTYSLITDNAEMDFAKIAPFSSQVGFEFLLNSIYACMFKRNFDSNIEILNNRQKTIQKGILSDNI